MPFSGALLRDSGIVTLHLLACAQRARFTAPDRFFSISPVRNRYSRAQCVDSADAPNCAIVQCCLFNGCFMPSKEVNENV